MGIVGRFSYEYSRMTMGMVGILAPCATPDPREKW